MTELFGISALWIIWGLSGLFFLIFLAVAPCHAIFLFPFIGFPLFWLLPLEYALPINLAIWLATPFLFRLVRHTMKKPVVDGFQSLIGTRAEVVSRSDIAPSGRYTVRAQGELWSGYSDDTLETGEKVNIVAVKGIGLVVARANNSSSPDKIDNLKISRRQ